MRYVFTAEDGDTLELDLPMAEAPPLFSTRTKGGKVYRRLPEKPQAAVKKDRHFVAWSQPAVVHRDGTPTGEWDPETTPYDKDPNSISYGLPVCDSWSDIENLKKQSNGGLIYDD